jgi:hypothetical protein
MINVDSLRRGLGLPDVPQINEGLAVTVEFFTTDLQQDPLAWLDSLRGIDFHHAVSRVQLVRHKMLVRYDKEPRDDIPYERGITPFGFFTDRGVSPFHTGTSWAAWRYKVFTVVTPTWAHVSTASTLSWHPFGDLSKPRRPVRFDHQSRVGGGVQYILSRADWPKLLYVSELHQASNARR